MAHKNPKKGGIKKISRLKSFAKPHPAKQEFRTTYFDPFINRRVKEILEEKNRH